MRAAELGKDRRGIARWDLSLSLSLCVVLRRTVTAYGLTRIDRIVFAAYRRAEKRIVGGYAGTAYWRRTRTRTRTRLRTCTYRNPIAGNQIEVVLRGEKRYARCSRFLRENTRAYRSRLS